MYATLVTIFVWLCGCLSLGPYGVSVHGAERAWTRQTVQTEASIAAADEAAAVRMQAEFAAECMACNCDLRLPSSCRSVARGAESLSSPHSAARSMRCAARTMPCDAARGYIAGHITRLFEFDLFRSSLRADFFLHSLCRLRI